MKILLATPCGGGNTHYMYCQSLLSQTFNAPERLKNQERYNICLYQIAGMSGLGKDRGIIASFAVRHDFDKIFFIDSDQEWKWEQFQKIVDSELPIVAGVVPIKRYPLQLNFTHKTEDKECFTEEKGLVTFQGLQRLREKHGQDEIPVACVGTGFMCIDLKVLHEMKKTCPEFLFIDDFTNKKKVPAWDFFQTGVVKGVYYGEDYSFCLQAKRLGFQSYINASVLIPHHGQHCYVAGNELVGNLDI